tara:strand:- start:351 stop:593 length:243 start_codon:yes stop_codon:yes gene_type:complete
MMDKENKGALFHNKDRKTDKHPNYTGKAVIWGKETRIAGWINETQKDGKTFSYISLKFEQPFEATNTSNPKKYTEKDLPF